MCLASARAVFDMVSHRDGLRKACVNPIMPVAFSFLGGHILIFVF